MLTIEEKQYLEALLEFAYDDIGHPCLVETEQDIKDKAIIKSIENKLSHL